MRESLIILSAILLLSSCRSSRFSSSSVVVPQHAEANVSSYTDIYASLAMSEMQRTGIPASITLAQGIIESDYGRSRLASQANNHFGIKCHSSWNGKKIYHDDDKRNECFRKYSKAEDSYIDHSDFLQNGSRYNFLFDLPRGDYKSWARGLKKAGYATNPRYANMLIDMIEKNRLHIYDELVISGKKRNERKTEPKSEQYTDKEKDDTNKTQGGSLKDIDNFIIPAKNNIEVRNRIEYIIINEGETYENLNMKFDLLSWEIPRYNELSDGDELYPGQIIYIQPKRNKAEAGNNFHTVKEGETMYSISQLYGIKLRMLYEKNRMEYGEVVGEGMELWLRKVKPEGL